jgi:amino acid adenylation domain-containing protein
MRSLDELMLAAARSTPEAPAVLESGAVGGFHVLSYRELEQRVEDYAAALDGIGVGIGDRVLLESDNSAGAVAMLLACSRLGATFVPVSPDMPMPRLLAIASSVEPVLHLQTVTGDRADLPAPVGLARFDPDGIAVRRPPAALRRYRREWASTDPAYVIFTSGTTGRPKGVVMSHRGVLSFYQGMLDLGIISSSDRVGSTSPLQFDFSLLDIGLALGSGALLIPVPRQVVSWPRMLLHFLGDTGATQVNGVPSIWRNVLRHEPDRLATLADQVRGVLFSGEGFPLPELRRLRGLLPHARVVNCFGPTEAMAFSLTDVPDPLPPDDGALPIGHAYPGAEMLLIDEKGAPVDEPGVIGEIHLRGPSLFTGYWDDAAATAAALVPDPLEARSGQRVYRSGDLARRDEHGELYFVGRADLQVKIRGNRVELGEIERRLLDFPSVATAAVVVGRRADGDPELVAFVVPAAGAGPVDGGALGPFCRQTLPEYMVPKRVIGIGRLPLTANGKTDRRALAARLTAPSLIGGPHPVLTCGHASRSSDGLRSPQRPRRPTTGSFRMSLLATNLAESDRFRAFGPHQLDEIAERYGLSADVRRTVELVSMVLPFRVNEYVLSNLIDWDRTADDPMFQLVFPQRGMLTEQDERSLAALSNSKRELRELVARIRRRLNPHPSGQQEYNVPTHDGAALHGVQHKYRETVLYFPSQGQTCHAYCTYCFRWAQFVGDPTLRFGVPDPTHLIAYLGEHPAVSDVLVTGGDPMVMSAARLRAHLEPLLAVGTVRTVRIGTKSVAYWPQRFVTDHDADDTLRLFEQVVASGRNLAVMAHFSHPRELSTAIARRALSRIRSTGALVYCQAPIIARVNDDATTWVELWQAELSSGAVPYYMFVERDTGPQDYFKVPLARSVEIFHRAYRRLPGLARTVRGPVMSTTPGKIVVDGVESSPRGRFFQLRLLQARNPALVGRPFRAHYSAAASWVDDLVLDRSTPADIAAAIAAPGLFGSVEERGVPA